jgi:adenine-specific DNA-methyltransferase
MKPRNPKPPLRIEPTTLWEYPSQDYGTTPHGDTGFLGATPAWVIWNLLQRYTRTGDTVLDPMCGSGTTIDVATELERIPLGFDLAPTRPDIRQSDARHLPLKNATVDFIFIDPPYSTHVTYSDDRRCIGKLDAAPTDDPSAENPYYRAMGEVFSELDRVLKPRRYLALYVSDSFKKGRPFMPIGFELFSILRQRFDPVDIVAVVRHNRKLNRSHWQTEAIRGNFFLRGFNYLMIFKKTLAPTPPASRGESGRPHGPKK